MITKIILLSLQILLSFAFIPLQNASREHYTTQTNDTLLLISEKMYSDQDFWPIIYAANKEKLSSDPQSLLQEDLNLRIPPSSLCQEFDFSECRDKARPSVSTQTYSENFCLNDIPRPQDSIRSFKLTVYNQLRSPALEGPQRYVQKGKVEQIPDDIRPNGKDAFLVSQGSGMSTYGVISYPIVGDINKLSVMWSVPRSPFVENYISVYYGPESAGPELLDAMYKDKLSKATSSRNTWTTYKLSDGLFADVSMTDINACNGTVRIYTKATVLKDGVYVIRSKDGHVFESTNNSLVHSDYDTENLAQRFYVKNAEKVCAQCATITSYVSHKILGEVEWKLGFKTFSGTINDFWSIHSQRNMFVISTNSGNFRVEDLSFELIE